MFSTFKRSRKFPREFPLPCCMHTPHIRDRHFFPRWMLNRCWGYGNYGQLGQGDTVSYGSTTWPLDGLPPVDLGTLPATSEVRKAKKAVAGTEFTCVLTEDGQVYLSHRVRLARVRCTRDPFSPSRVLQNRLDYAARGGGIGGSEVPLPLDYFLKGTRGNVPL